MFPLLTVLPLGSGVFFSDLSPLDSCQTKGDCFAHGPIPLSCHKDCH